MSFARKPPAAPPVGRSLIGRISPTVSRALAFFLMGISIVPRLSSYLVARKFQTILAGLKNRRIDETTEEEFTRAVPYMKLGGNGASYGQPQERWYNVILTNESAWRRFFQFFSEHPWLPRTLISDTQTRWDFGT